MDSKTFDQEGPWTKEKIENMVTKFSEKFAIIMLKKHRKFCRPGLTHLDAKPIFKKNRSDTYGPPCTVESDQTSLEGIECTKANTLSVLILYTEH